MSKIYETFKKIDFNDEWYYVGEPIRLPHDAMINSDRNPNAPDIGEESYFVGEKYEYEKVFVFPNEWQNKQIKIEFEGVCQETTLYVNDKEVFFWPYAYTGYVIDITEYINWGSGNKIRVCADRSLRETTRWYSGGGITRPVFLHVCDKEQCSKENYAVLPQRHDLKVSSKEGLLIDGKPIKLKGTGVHHDNGIIGAISLKDAELRKVSKLKELGYNCIRTAHNPPSRYFLEACDELGMYVIVELFDVWRNSKMKNDYSRYFEEWWKKDLKSTVDLVKQHPCVIMYSIGNEISDTGTEEGIKLGKEIVGYLKQLDSQLLTVNSINGMFTIMPKMHDILAEILPNGEEVPNDFGAIIAAFDTHITEVMTHNAVTEDTKASYEVVDVAGYNYMDSRYEMDGKLFPDRVILGTETFPKMIGRNWPLVEKLPYVIGDFNWTGIDFLGEGGLGKMDYEESHMLTGPYPWLTSNTGDMDIIGNRRPQSFYRDVVMGNSQGPYIFVERPELFGMPCYPNNWSWPEVLPSWTWAGYEGSQIRVEVYSKADEVSLIVNGKEVCRQKVIDWKEARSQGERVIPYIVSFDTVYEPGEICAKEYKNGKEIGKISLSTNKEAKKIVLKPETCRAKSDGDSLVYVNIEIQDEDGNISFVDVPVTVEIVGGNSAKLLALGNGNPKNEEKYNSNMHMTYNGKALAVLRTTKNPGTITFKITAKGLNEAIVDIDIL